MRGVRAEQDYGTNRDERGDDFCFPSFSQKCVCAEQKYDLYRIFKYRPRAETQTTSKIRVFLIGRKSSKKTAI
jgi:hypothetical protein